MYSKTTCIYQRHLQVPLGAGPLRGWLLCAGTALRPARAPQAKPGHGAALGPRQVPNSTAESQFHVSFVYVQAKRSPVYCIIDFSSVKQFSSASIVTRW